MIFEKVAALVSEQFDVDEEDINQDMLFEELGADETDISDLALVLSREFDILISDEDIADISDVGDMVQLIDGLLSPIRLD